MAQTSELNCPQAQKLMQLLLDRRWTKPVPPRLQDHLEVCGGCRSFLSLFDYQPISLPQGPAPGFSSRIITILKQEQTRKPGPRRQALFVSAAAAVLVALLGFYFLMPGRNPSQVASVSPQTFRDLLPMWQTAKQEIEQVPERWQSFQPPSLDLLAAFPEFELPIPSDPLASTLPNVQALGTTLQAAMEPIQMPAKEAYHKVKMIMHDPNVKKWFDSVTNGAM